MEEIADDCTHCINHKQTVGVASGGPINDFPFTQASTLLMGSWTDRREREERELTEGEEEGVETDLSAQRNLRDEPLCYTADGH